MAAHYSGRGDPQATLSLLWGLPRSTKPGRKPSLAPADIGAAALALADAEGLEALSMRALASRLGVGAMSLYRYVPGKPELLDLIVELAYAELPRQRPQGHWQDRLAQVARDAWALYLKHPWLLEISTFRASLGPYSLQKYERELNAVADAGMDDLEMDLVVAAVSDFVRGAARSLLEARSATQVTGQTDAEWWNVHSGLLAQLVDPQVFPLAVRIGSAAGAEYGATTDPARSFEFGLHSLIRGFESRPRGAAPLSTRRSGPARRR